MNSSYKDSIQLVYLSSKETSKGYTMIKEYNITQQFSVRFCSTTLARFEQKIQAGWDVQRVRHKWIVLIRFLFT